MNRDEIRSLIAENLRRANLPFAMEDIRVQPDPYGGWRIAVISAGFATMSWAERHTVALRGLEGETIQWVDLLTPEEKEWAGNLPLDVDVEDLPLWPEALARQRRDEPVVFISDLDEDLEKPIVVTFYSLRGGVGRSTALAYTAKVLAKRGYAVLCVDLDLEAPGLAVLFGKEDEVRPGTGVVAALLQLEQGEKPDLRDHVIRVSNSLDLYCLPAGIPDADYARRLRFIDPEAWYREEHNPLRSFLELMSDLPFKPDVVLFDARTGMSPISGPLLFDLSDLAIITFFPHPQARLGTEVLVRALFQAHTRRRVNSKRLTPEPRFLISPVPPREVERYRRRAEEWILTWLEPVLEQQREREREFDPKDIFHVVPYLESIAVSDKTLDDESVLRVYEPVADWVARFLPTEKETDLAQRIATYKPKILETLNFSSGAAEYQADLMQVFVPTDVFLKARQADRPLVIGRKGMGKTALFRWMLEDPATHSIVVMCPAPLRSQYPWVPDPDRFAAIEDSMKDKPIGWREFWTLHTALATFRTLRRGSGDSPPLPAEALREALAGVLDTQEASELAYSQALARALQVPNVGLFAWDWLQQLDRCINFDHYLLFDGLDTGFGSSSVERDRRRQALEGLFTFVLDREPSLKRLRFKILLREDIWLKTRFENKSHLDIRAVRLEWRTETDYVKTILKQAMLNVHFRHLVEQTVPNADKLDIEFWPDAIVKSVWNILVGERMKGGKTAYTINWVWNRLADGNRDHSPRALFELFRHAIDWERSEHRGSPYERSIIRPRALTVALDRVSEQALQSLREEFGELEELLERLKNIGRSPFEASLLYPEPPTPEDLEQVALAQEVGLLEVYEKTEDEILRFRVPDLYRLALEMTRKGQL